MTNNRLYYIQALRPQKQKCTPDIETRKMYSQQLISIQQNYKSAQVHRRCSGSLRQIIPKSYSVVSAGKLLSAARVTVRSGGAGTTFKFITMT